MGLRARLHPSSEAIDRMCRVAAVLLTTISAGHAAAQVTGDLPSLPVGRSRRGINLTDRVQEH